MRGSHIVAIEIYLIDQRGDKMILLHEGELLHTESSADILEHYGVKGMKWGKRLGTSAKKAVNYYGHTNRMNRKIDANVAKRDRTQKQLDSLNKEMSTRSNFRKLRVKTAAAQATEYGVKNLGTPASNVALGAAIGGGYGAIMARKLNREKRSKLVDDIVSTNTKIANIEYKRDKRVNKKSYKNTSKSLKKEYSSKLRKSKRTYKDNKYANREKLDRFYDYNTQIDLSVQ